MTLDLANWMGDSSQLHDVLMTRLHIPGTHDSMSFSLTTKLPLSPLDCPSVVYKLRGLPCTKNVVKNWSTCQPLDVAAQLDAGIRYFDVRTAYYAAENSLRTIHGLFGATTTNLMAAFQNWIRAHPAEIVILDFNHFDGFTSDALYDQLINIIVSTFGDQIIPSPKFDLNSLTLAGIYKARNGRGGVIVTFQTDHGSGRENFYSTDQISSPWANTNTLTKLLPYLVNALTQRAPSGQLFVTQGILTPQTNDIVKGLNDTLAGKLGVPCRDAVEQWLPTLEPSLQKRLNIVMVDCADSAFSEKIIASNASII